MEYLSGAHRSEKQLIHMLSNRAMDPKGTQHIIKSPELSVVRTRYTVAQTLYHASLLP